MLITKNISGQYITLEPLSQSHKIDLKSLVEDSSIWKYFPYKASGNDFETWFESTIKKTNDKIEMCFVVRCNKTQKIVGCTRYYSFALPYRRLAIGHTFYHADVRGTKVNPECKKLLLQTAFETLGIERVELMADINNQPSVAAIKKLGATQEGILRQYMTLENGYKRDTAVFSILKSEWPSIRKNLENRLTK
jgi:RimJ/RimL family protein N-acetyltransferase